MDCKANVTIANLLQPSKVYKKNWRRYKDIPQLEAVQRYFTNKIPSCRFLPYHLRLKKLSLHSLLHRRKVADLIFFHSIVTGRTLLSLAPHLVFIPPSVTRGHNLKMMVLRLKYVKTGQNF